MHRRKLKALALLILASLAVAPIQSESQTKKKQTTKRATTRRAAKKPARKAAPKAPAVGATAPRSAGQLAADMASIAGHVRSGQFGIMAVSLTRGDTLFQSNAGTP